MGWCLANGITLTPGVMSYVDIALINARGDTGWCSPTVSMWVVGRVYQGVPIIDALTLVAGQYGS